MHQHSTHEQAAINTPDFVSFLKKAKQATYANNANKPERIEGCKEYIYQDGPWHYRDYYAGSTLFGGMELVRFNHQPIWTMSYYGGILEPALSHLTINTLTEQAIFEFLKKALLLCTSELPLRGPEEFSEGRWGYKNTVQGSIMNFWGHEVITYDNVIVCEQRYVGGGLLFASKIA
ncbi:MAG: DUF5680 domain-containing protein [Candidatus Babeliales bacterium]|jgi:hypothetical protein